MAFAASVSELQSETTCPLCLDYLRDAVTLDCGHNFCDPCIRQRWEDLEDVFPCPVCSHHCLQGKTKRNTQLRHITAIVKQLATGRNKRKRQEEQRRCEKHNEVLDVFCEEDLQLLCPQCRASPDHQDHRLIPTEIAVVSQRKKLKRYMELLKKQISDAKMAYANQLAECTQERWKIEHWKEELGPEFEQFQSFLENEEVSVLMELQKEEKAMEDKIYQNKSLISSHMEILQNLLCELTEKSLQSDLNLLASMQSAHDQFPDLPSLTVFTFESKKRSFTLPPHYFGLHKMIGTFQRSLTLDVKTVHPDLVVSSDQLSVTLVANPTHIQENFQEKALFPAVLCSEEFSGGRHFWQIEVKGIGELSFGVCNESYRENIRTSAVSEHDFWQFSHFFSLPWGTWYLEPNDQMKRFGVFLDYELGELSFYDLNRKSCMHKITRAFPGRVIPFFALEPSSRSLMIRLVTKQ